MESSPTLTSSQLTSKHTHDEVNSIRKSPPTLTMTQLASKQQLNNWKNVSTQILSNQCHLYFLSQCRREQLVPKFISMQKFTVTSNVQGITHKINHLKTKFHRKLLNLMIREKFTLVKRCVHEIKIIEAKLAQLFPSDYMMWFYQIQAHKIDRKRDINLFHKNKKLNQLRKQMGFLNVQPDINNQRIFSNKLYNLTNEELPSQLVNTVKLGGNFSFPILQKQKTEVVFNFIKEFENSSHLIDSKLVKDLRKSIVNELQKYIDKPIYHNANQKKILYDLQQTKQYLRNNKNLLIVKADKGGACTVIEKTQYDQKLEQQFEDSSTYRLCPKDQSMAQMRKLQEIIKDWKSKGYIDNNSIL